MPKAARLPPSRCPDEPRAVDAALRSPNNERSDTRGP